MKPPAFQFYADNFVQGTMDMEQDEVGAYMRLLCYQWNHGAIPSDQPRLQRVAGGPVSNHVLLKFKTGQDGLLRNVRMEEERSKQDAFRASRAENGAKGGRPKASEKLVVSASFVVAEPTGKAKESSPSSSSSPSSVPDSSFQNSQTQGGMVEKTPSMVRLGKLWKRRDSTVWSKDEIKALKAIEPIDPEDIATIEKYYSVKWQSGEVDIRRRDLVTLLNNWNGEIDRARAYRPNPYNVI